MIADNENPTPIHEVTLEEDELMERSSAPTVLDLRAAFKDLFTDLDTIVEAQQDLTAPNDRAPQ
jgi:hypothetical protein